MRSGECTFTFMRFNCFLYAFRFKSIDTNTVWDYTSRNGEIRRYIGLYQPVR